MIINELIFISLISNLSLLTVIAGCTKLTQQHKVQKCVDAIVVLGYPSPNLGRRLGKSLARPCCAPAAQPGQAVDPAG